MTFHQIPGNTSVFLDANILVYYFTPDPTFGAQCQVLMERIYKWQDFVAYTSERERAGSPGRLPAPAPTNPYVPN